MTAPARTVTIPFFMAHLLGEISFSPATHRACAVRKSFLDTIILFKSLLCDAGRILTRLAGIPVSEASCLPRSICPIRLSVRSVPMIILGHQPIRAGRQTVSDTRIHVEATQYALVGIGISRCGDMRRGGAAPDDEVRVERPRHRGSRSSAPSGRDAHIWLASAERRGQAM